MMKTQNNRSAFTPRRIEEEHRQQLMTTHPSSSSPPANLPIPPPAAFDIEDLIIHINGFLDPLDDSIENNRLVNRRWSLAIVQAPYFQRSLRRICTKFWEEELHRHPMTHLLEIYETHSYFYFHVGTTSVASLIVICVSLTLAVMIGWFVYLLVFPIPIIPAIGAGFLYFMERQCLLSMTGSTEPPHDAFMAAAVLLVCATAVSLAGASVVLFVKPTSRAIAIVVALCGTFFIGWGMYIILALKCGASQSARRVECIAHLSALRAFGWDDLSNNRNRNNRNDDRASIAAFVKERYHLDPDLLPELTPQ